MDDRKFIMPLVMLIFTVVRWIPLAMLSLVGMGWGFMLLVNTTNSLVQTQVPDDLRGRVMSVYILVFFGCMPIGSFIAGQCAAYLGEPLTIIISACLLRCLPDWFGGDGSTEKTGMRW
jgi:predicted MFS family arabinose efflux permease